MSSTLNSQEESKLLNAKVYEAFQSGDPTQIKEATDSINDYTRTKVREESFYDKIIPPLPIGFDELDRQLNTEHPVKIVDREPDSPAAMSIGFGKLPENLYIRGDRYPVHFERIVTPRFTKDVGQLMTWIMDIRQIISDNAIKDMLVEQDSKFIRACNNCMGGAPNAVVATSGVAQWVAGAGGITRDALMDSLKVLNNTPSSLETHTILINHVTIKDVMKLDRAEFGGDLAQDIMRQGWTLTEFLGKNWLITIKKDLVPNGSMFHFADPKFIGKNYVLEDTQMYIRREAYMLEFFAYKFTGGSIGFTSGIGRYDF